MIEHTAWTIGEEAGRHKTLRPFGSVSDRHRPAARIPEIPLITTKPAVLRRLEDSQ